jgi:hypothetical protein
MSTTALLAATLGSKITKSLLSVWLKDKELLKSAAEIGVEAFSKHTQDHLEARKAKRVFEDLVDKVIGDLSVFISNEHKSLETAKGDLKQIVEGIITIISSEDFFDLCLNERLSVSRFLAGSSELRQAQVKKRHVNQDDFDSLFQFVAGSFLSTIHSLPTFNRTAIRKILEDTELIVEKLSRIQSTLDLTVATQDDSNRYAQTYRKHFSRRFRKIQLFGLDARSLAKSYTLAIGYISLTLADEEGTQRSALKRH